MLINGATSPIPPHPFLSCAAAVVYGLLAGSFVFGTLGLRPAVGKLPLDLQLRLRPLLIHRISKAMPLLMILSIVLSGLTLFYGGPANRICDWAASLLSLSVFIMTLAVHRPINLQILAWSDNPPVDAAKIIDRWNRADTIRCILAVAGYVFFQWGNTR
ncbi:anthrone oxygenase family protein [Tunturibacter empetritectus]|uniref:anthrone oxygenase family protein n=1 Tax=Tunturiibacter empetritectus TaxID=3069691 RepID=UPI0015CA9699